MFISVSAMAAKNMAFLYSFKSKEMVNTSFKKPVLVVNEGCIACDTLMTSYKKQIEAKGILVVAMFEPSEKWFKEVYPLKNDVYNYLGVKEKIKFTGSISATPALIGLDKKVVYGTSKIIKKLGIKAKTMSKPKISYFKY